MKSKFNLYLPSTPPNHIALLPFLMGTVLCLSLFVYIIEEIDGLPGAAGFRLTKTYIVLMVMF